MVALKRRKRKYGNNGKERLRKREMVPSQPCLFEYFVWWQVRNIAIHFLFDPPPEVGRWRDFSRRFSYGGCWVLGHVFRSMVHRCTAEVGHRTVIFLCFRVACALITTALG
eukprot:RCo052730